LAIHALEVAEDASFGIVDQQLPRPSGQKLHRSATITPVRGWKPNDMGARYKNEA